MQPQADVATMETMFAPWCPTCASRMLLGPRRVEGIEPGPHGPRAILRCYCGTALVWSAEEEVAEAAGPASPPEAPASLAARTTC